MPRNVSVGIGVHPECDDLVRADAADVGLIEVRHDLHLGQVRGEDEQRRRLHAGGDRLADVDAARNHQAVNRRLDDRVLQVDLVLVDRGLRLRRPAPRLVIVACCDSLRPARCPRDLGGIEVALREADCRAESSLARA